MLKASVISLTGLIPFLVVVLGILALVGVPQSALIAVVITTLLVYPLGIWVGATSIITLLTKMGDKLNVKR